MSLHPSFYQPSVWLLSPTTFSDGAVLRIDDREVFARRLDPTLALFGELITRVWHVNELTKQHSVIPLLSLIGVWLFRREGWVGWWLLQLDESRRESMSEHKRTYERLKTNP